MQMLCESWKSCDFNVDKCLQGEHETLPDDKTKEESDEEEDDVEDSGRIRFKSERKEGSVVRLAGSQRRNIPETLGTNFFNFSI